MAKIVTVCGQGLGSSLIVEMNVKQVLDELGVTNNFEVSHENLNTYQPAGYDYVICGQDLAPSIAVIAPTKKLVLTNIMDLAELKAKLTKALSEQ